MHDEHSDDCKSDLSAKPISNGGWREFCSVHKDAARDVHENRARPIFHSGAAYATLPFIGPY
jgi:hypothetical protein